MSPSHLLLLGLEDELLDELLPGLWSLGPFFLLLVACRFLFEEAPSSTKVGGSQLSWTGKKRVHQKQCDLSEQTLEWSERRPTLLHLHFIKIVVFVFVTGRHAYNL